MSNDATITAFTAMAVGAQDLARALTDLATAIRVVIASLDKILPRDTIQLYERMLLAGWRHRAAEQYAMSVPAGTAWLYPTPRPPERSAAGRPRKEQP